MLDHRLILNYLDDVMYTVLIRARDELSEEEELKQRLLAHLSANTSELSLLTKTALRIRHRAIDVDERLSRSTSRLRRRVFGRRALSAEPRLSWPTFLPLYYRRRALSAEPSSREWECSRPSTVNNSIGMHFVKSPLKQPAANHTADHVKTDATENGCKPEPVCLPGEFFA